MKQPHSQPPTPARILELYRLGSRMEIIAYKFRITLENVQQAITYEANFVPMPELDWCV